MRIKRSLTLMMATMVGLVAVILFGMPAHAAQPGRSTSMIMDSVLNSVQPKATYDKLGVSDREKFLAAVTPTSMTITISTTKIDIPQGDGNGVLAYSGCWAMYLEGASKNIFGKTLYTAWQTTAVCVRNGNVYHVWVSNAGGETSTPGWRIAREPVTATMNVGWEGRGKAQYYFVFGAGGWDIQHPTNCLQGRLNGNGVSKASGKSCNLAAQSP